MANITPWSGAIPAKNQSVVEFNTNVQRFLAYIATLAPQINQAISEAAIIADVQPYVPGSTYTHPIIVAGSNGLRYSLTAGVPVTGDDPVTSVSGRWVSLTLDASSLDTAPHGAVFLHFGDTPLVGTLELDGSAISRTSYSRVFAIYGIKYGSGNGSTTFNLPDPRGQFPRVWSHGSGVDPDAATRTNRGDGTTGDNIGTKQASQYAAHSHLVYLGAPNPGVSGTSVNNAQNGLSLTSTIPTVSSGGNETRSTNINVMLCVKY